MSEKIPEEGSQDLQPQDAWSGYSKKVGHLGPIAKQGSEQLEKHFADKSKLGLFALAYVMPVWAGLSHDAKDEIARRKTAKTADQDKS